MERKKKRKLELRFGDVGCHSQVNYLEESFPFYCVRFKKLLSFSFSYVSLASEQTPSDRRVSFSPTPWHGRECEEVTSHAGFGQHFPSRVPGVPGVGRTTGTPQGWLLPGLWPEEQVGASSTVCPSACCCALWPGPEAGAHRGRGEGAAWLRVPRRTSRPCSADGRYAGLWLLTFLLSLFFERTIFFLILLFYYSKCSQNRRESVTCVLF